MMKKVFILLALGVVLMSAGLKTKNLLEGSWEIKKAVYNGQNVDIEKIPLKVKRFNPNGTFDRLGVMYGSNVTQAAGKYMVHCDSIYSEVPNGNQPKDPMGDFSTFIYHISKDTLRMQGTIYVPTNAQGTLFGKIRLSETWVRVK